MHSDFGFTGHLEHEESGMALAVYRGYLAKSGRWLSRDPIGEKGGLNLYGCVVNSPLVATDRLGLDFVMGGTGPGSPSLHALVGRTVDEIEAMDRSGEEAVKGLSDVMIDNVDTATGATARYGLRMLWEKLCKGATGAKPTLDPKKLSQNRL